jgi:hypothetical protein
MPSSEAGEAEERGGGKVASLIVVDIHNIPISKMVYFCREEYTKWV